MSKEAHIETLLNRHLSIEAELKQAMSTLSTDDLTLSELKRRKLQLKDEIERLQKVN